MAARRMPPHADRPAGFTLVELLVVLVVVALIAALAAPRLAGPFAGAGFRQAGQELAAALRGARSLARESGEPVALVLDLRAHRFGRLSPDGRIRWLGSWPPDAELRVRTAEELIDPGGDHARILFFPDGTSLGGSVTLARGENRIVITIDWLTGAVRLGQ